MVTDAEIVVMMQEMKAEGRTDDEIGYAVTKAIYDVPETTEYDLRMFSDVLNLMLEQNPDDGFVLGSKRWVTENYKPETIQ